MLVQRNLARTTQHARLVLQKEITSVSVSLDLLVMTVKTVGNNLTQVSKKGPGGYGAGWRIGERSYSGDRNVVVF